MIIDNNAMLVAFVVTNLISNSIFDPISPISEMEEIIVAGSLKSDRPGLTTIPILLTVKILLLTKIKIKNLI